MKRLLLGIILSLMIIPAGMLFSACDVEEFFASLGKPSYIVTFDSLGGNEVESQTIQEGKTVKQPAPPNKLGYKFICWFNGEDVWNFETSKVWEDTNLTANWQANAYTINYYLYNGTNNPNNPDYHNYNTEITLANASKENYNFNGWYDNPEFTGDEVGKIPATMIGTINLYAKFTLTNYTISYVLFDGENDEDNITEYTYGTNFTLLEPTKENYNFLGWFDTQDFSGLKITKISPVTSGNLILYANFKVCEYSITYYINGGENNSKNPATYAYGTTFTLFDATKQNALFQGWYTTQNFSGEKFISISATTKENLKLYAKFTTDSYSITYHLNNGQNNALNISSYAFGTTFTFKEPTKNNHIFGGWYDNNEYTGLKITKITETTSGNLDLYAYFVSESDYVLTDHITITTRNQGNYNLCWSFAATRSLETYLLINYNVTIDISESWASLAYWKYSREYASTLTSNDVPNYTFGDLGHFLMYQEALNTYGIVTESDMPYSLNQYVKNNPNNAFNEFSQDASTILQDIEFDWIGYYNETLQNVSIDDCISNIKDYIVKYGSVYTQINMNDSDLISQGEYYIYSSTSGSNHAVSIIGWDDDYTYGDKVGAFIVMNSYGATQEYIYVSYDDANIIGQARYIKDLTYNPAP